MPLPQARREGNPIAVLGLHANEDADATEPDQCIRSGEAPILRTDRGMGMGAATTFAGVATTRLSF